MIIFRPLQTAAQFYEWIEICTEDYETDYQASFASVAYFFATGDWGSKTIENLHKLLPFLGAIQTGEGIYATLGDTSKERVLNALLLKSTGLLYRFEQWEYEYWRDINYV